MQIAFLFDICLTVILIIWNGINTETFKVISLPILITCVLLLIDKKCRNCTSTLIKYAMFFALTAFQRLPFCTTMYIILLSSGMTGIVFLIEYIYHFCRTKK